MCALLWMCEDWTEMMLDCRAELCSQSSPGHSSVPLMHIPMNTHRHIQAHWNHAQWAANAVWADVKSITGVVPYIYRE